MLGWNASKKGEAYGQVEILGERFKSRINISGGAYVLYQIYRHGVQYENRKGIGFIMRHFAEW